MGKNNAPTKAQSVLHKLVKGKAPMGKAIMGMDRIEANTSFNSKSPKGGTHKGGRNRPSV